MVLRSSFSNYGFAAQYLFRFRDMSHVPALLLWGTQDNIIEPRSSKVQFAYLRHPQSNGYWLHDASHALNFDSLPEVYALTSAFLDPCDNERSDVSGNESSSKRAKGGWFAEALIAALPSRKVVQMLPNGCEDGSKFGESEGSNDNGLPHSRL